MSPVELRPFTTICAIPDDERNNRQKPSMTFSQYETKRWGMVQSKYIGLWHNNRTERLSPYSAGHDMFDASSDQERHATLRSFLRTGRLRIDPKTNVLGQHERLPSRRGKRVTQEEMAEAIGVSRTWYSLLESGAAIRASTHLIDRLASAIMLTAHERYTLFRLALPELEPGYSVSSQSRAAYAHPNVATSK